MLQRQNGHGPAKTSPRAADDDRMFLYYDHPRGKLRWYVRLGGGDTRRITMQHRYGDPSQFDGRSRSAAIRERRFATIQQVLDRSEPRSRSSGSTTTA